MTNVLDQGRRRIVGAAIAAPGLLAGGIIAFAAALGEFGAVITFVSNVPGETQTLPHATSGAVHAV